jgi:hypothetical protein
MACIELMQSSHCVIIGLIKTTAVAHEKLEWQTNYNQEQDQDDNIFATTQQHRCKRIGFWTMSYHQLMGCWCIPIRGINW